MVTNPSRSMKKVKSTTSGSNASSSHSSSASLRGWSVSASMTIARFGRRDWPSKRVAFKVAYCGVVL